MFVIRAMQVCAFERAWMGAFALRMVVHVEEHFAKRCQALGKVGTHELVRCGIERAWFYGFTSEREICKYLNLVFFFGQDFDVDPRIEWARPVLNASYFASTGEKMAALYQAAVEAARTSQSQ